jgi:hypothetical protein
LRRAHPPVQTYALAGCITVADVLIVWVNGAFERITGSARLMGSVVLPTIFALLLR